MSSAIYEFMDKDKLHRPESKEQYNNLISVFKDLGGNEWVKGDYYRIYLNKGSLAKLYNLEASYYKTGNVSSARLNGERISNSRATSILTDFSVCKFWLDVTTGSVYSKNLDENLQKELTAKIKERL